MKKFACIIFEVPEAQTVEDVVEKITNACGMQNVELRTQQYEEQESWEIKLKDILRELGINKSLKGYSALFDIMAVISENPEYKEHIPVMDLYTLVTKRTGEPYSHIERRIRTVIEKIYEHNPKEYANSILRISNKSDMKLTNAKFIAILADIIFG